MNFIDEVYLKLIAGRGGKGCVSFRREKGVPRGGPNGGDGGRGGSIYLQGSKRINTLLHLYYKRTIRAEDGKDGKGSDRTGRSGKDIMVYVPMGTEVYDMDTGELIADITEDRGSILIARGGRGGLGNRAFATAVMKAPTITSPPEDGEVKSVRLSLKVMCDVGLVGFPNAGKSTLLSVISKARPKIAPYPFTTLTPHLGMVSVDESTSYVVADIPGLIEGASKGAGLGISFLKHIERSRILLHLISPVEEGEQSPLEKFTIINREMESYAPSLMEKLQIIVITKADRLLPEKEKEVVEVFKNLGYHTFVISAITGRGVQELVRETGRMIDRIKGLDP